ncbi:MAG: peptidylprolyl isomerase [Ignavibacteriaceae bacterium]
MVGINTCFTTTGFSSGDSLQLKYQYNYSINDSVVASVGPIKISADEFYYSYEFGPAFIKRKKDSKEHHLKYMINEKLLALDGYSRDIDEKENVESLLYDYENDLATEELFKDDILSKVEIREGEIDTIITQKQLELDIRWLYAASEEELNNYTNALSYGASFDSLFQLQFEDSIFQDDRSLQTSRFSLGKKNSDLAEIIDTLPIGEFSNPVKVDDGWYILIINNVWQNIITTETEMIKLRQEAINYLTQKKMDVLSQNYINDLMISQNPIIKRQVFNVLRSYIGMYSLNQDLYKEWKLKENLNQSLQELGVTKENIGNLELVKMDEGIVELKEFLNWYWNRDQYIKLNKADLQSYSISLENIIWQMLRDKLLTEIANERNYNQSDIVKSQSKWWRDKIVYSAVKKEIIESVLLKENEIKLQDKDLNNSKSISEARDQEILIKLQSKIDEMKSKYEISINEELLDEIEVSEENNPKTIDVYTVKKGGLIPRPAYPSIDFEWVNWE